MSATGDEEAVKPTALPATDTPGTVEAAVDNDVLIKAAVLDLADALVTAHAGILGQARFVVLGRVQRMALRGDTNTAAGRAAALLARCQTLEPDDAETALAAEIEREAALRDLALDGGESLLAAIVASRPIPEFHTGDKRAIGAFEQIILAVPRMAIIRGRVRSLEQLALAAAARMGTSAVGGAVCAEPDADKTLTICSECRSARTLNVQALESYIARLRTAAPTILAD